MSRGLDQEDTIAAIASARGPAQRGLIRITGPEAWKVAAKGFHGGGEPRAGRVVVGGYRLAGLVSMLPATLVYAKGPRSYTSQDLVEVNTVGSPPLLDLLLTHLLSGGARLAEAGEFTLRAFLSGRIDLTRAEAVLGVIDSDTPEQLEAALRQLAGGLAGPIERLRDRLLDVLAHLEAGLDFVEEEDVSPLERAALAAELSEGGRQLDELARRFESRERAGGLPRVVLVGPPNAGKSSLFNALVGADRAIVSAQAGTTRDYLVGLCEFEGGRFELIDTAGREESAAEWISARAQAIGAGQIERADLLLLCVAPGQQADGILPAAGSRRTLRVATKCDQGAAVAEALATSARTGAGLAELRAAISTRLAALQRESDPLAHTGARCRDSLIQAGACLARAAEALGLGGAEELVAIDLREALEALGRVVGTIVTDDILDRIFKRFCIGK